MQPFGKRGLTAGAVALTLGLAAMGGSLVTATTALAAAPAGNACNPTDGKINGRGSTYQTNAQIAWWAAYNSEICGITNESPADAAGANMGVYNSYTTLTGSGQGETATNCRTDAYAGSDIPYNEAQLTAFDGTPGNTSVAGISPCTTVAALAAPFAPDASTNSVYPSTSDGTGNVMSFPIAGSAESLRVNLTAAECGTSTKPTIELTGLQVSAILGGSILKWNDPSLVANNSDLSGCTFRSSASCATTTRARPRSSSSTSTTSTTTWTTATCAPGTTWASYQTTPNTTWPGSSTATGTCSAYISNTGHNGGPALLSLLDTTAGGIGYADLSDAVNDASTNVQVTVQNAAGTAYVSPASGLAANCNLSSVTPPDNGAATGIVGLDSSNNWGTDNATVNNTGTHSDASDAGSAYPICGLTWDLVYSGLSAATGSPIAALTANQRRTLYSYMTFLLSSLGQSLLPNEYYTALPTAWQANILSGFQNNY